MTVVVPFAGDSRAAEEVVANFAALRLGPGDEVIVGDNSAGGVFAEIDLPERWFAAPALGEGSPARARNAGAERAAGEWILFVDSDCVPAPDLIERHLAEPIPERCGIVAGAITALAGQTSLAARYAASREHLDQAIGLEGDWPWAHSANLLVRAAAWRELGGFLEGIRVAEDVDFCWRARRAGWELRYNAAAVVEHAHRDTFGALWSQAVVADASEHWVHRRWPEVPRPRTRTARALGRAAVGAPLFLLTGRPRRALFKLWDAALALTPWAARFRANRAIERPAPPAAVEVWAEEWPVALDLPAGAHVVAARRRDVPALDAPRAPVRYLEDFTPLERARALARLALSRPVAVLRDRGGRPLREIAPAVLLNRSADPRGAEAERVARLRKHRRRH